MRPGQVGPVNENEQVGKFLPETVTCVPPLVGPVFGDTVFTEGAFAGGGSLATAAGAPAATTAMVSPAAMSILDGWNALARVARAVVSVCTVLSPSFADGHVRFHSRQATPN